MTFNEAREMIIEKIIEVYEESVCAHNENYFSAYITPDGKMYSSEEIDSCTIPAPVFEGRDRRICVFKGYRSVLPENEQEREEIIRETGSEEEAEKWIIPDIVNEYANEFLEGEYGYIIDELADWISD